MIHLLLAGALALVQDTILPRTVRDTSIVTTRQTISPVGATAVFDGRVHAVAFGNRPGELWALVLSDDDSGWAYRLSWRDNRVLERRPIGLPGLQAVVTDHSTGTVLVTAAGERHAKGSGRDSIVRVLRVVSLDADSTIVRVDGIGEGRQLPSPPAVGRCGGQSFMVVPKRDADSVIVFDATSYRIRWRVPTGVAPFAAAIDPVRCKAYITNWGGRRPVAGDRTGQLGVGWQRAVTDSVGIASTGTVTRIDLETGRVSGTIRVGLHPSAIAFDSARREIYVADGNDDALSVIDADRGRIARTIVVNPFVGRPFGVAPTAIAVAPDGGTVYVTLGGVNAIAVIDPARGTVRGLIPTGWYPASVVISDDGSRLAVGTLLGVGSGDAAHRLDAYASDFFPDAIAKPTARYVHHYRGTVAVIDVPDSTTLAANTRAVAANTHLALADHAIADLARAAMRARSGVPARAVPERPGEPSLIRHVVYIVKENRSYDQLFGDIGKGESDSTLTMYGRRVTPNQHRLAQEFVLLDNAYASGGNSGDGHQWLTQADEVDYTMYPGYSAQSYPFDGTDPLAYARTGFIWEDARRHGRSVQIFGEYAGNPDEFRQRDTLAWKKALADWRVGTSFLRRFHTVAPLASVDRVLVRNFPQFDEEVPDVVRGDIFLAHLRAWTRSGTMPSLVILQLPWDHTVGTVPHYPTPAAMVADNDLALGRVVEGLTHSPFWKSMAIFVVEDDAQDGVDHIDGHRMPALVVSPYVRRGSIDHTMYAHPSILKTIELMLGLPHLTLFDLVANDMRASFTDVADVEPYVASEPAQALDVFNPPAVALDGEAREGALASARMNFRVPDAAPADTLNLILWHAARGWEVPYPGVRHGPFVPAIETDVILDAPSVAPYACCPHECAPTRRLRNRCSAIARR